MGHARWLQRHIRCPQLVHMSPESYSRHIPRACTIGSPRLPRMDFIQVPDKPRLLHICHLARPNGDWSDGTPHPRKMSQHRCENKDLDQKQCYRTGLEWDIINIMLSSPRALDRVCSEPFGRVGKSQSWGACDVAARFRRTVFGRPVAEVGSSPGCIDFWAWFF